MLTSWAGVDHQKRRRRRRMSWLLVIWGSRSLSLSVEPDDRPSVVAEKGGMRRQERCTKFGRWIWNECEMSWRWRWLNYNTDYERLELGRTLVRIPSGSGEIRSPTEHNIGESRVESRERSSVDSLPIICYTHTPRENRWKSQWEGERAHTFGKRLYNLPNNFKFNQ